jgi:hypothetical protein
VTWRGLDMANTDLADLIAAYFVDQKLLSASTARLIAERRPVPTERLAGYDGRLFDWLAEMLNYGPPDGPEVAWPIILELVAQAPDEEALAFIGSGPVEDLVNKHGVQFEGPIVSQATTDSRFRLALRHVWPHDGVADTLKELIAASRLVDRE